jgi:hypothetical protein
MALSQLAMRPRERKREGEGGRERRGRKREGREGRQLHYH